MTCGGGGGSSTIALSMLSLVGGMYLLIKSCSAEVCCRLFVKIIGWIIVVISIIMILCSGYWKIVKIGHHGWGYGKGKGMMMRGMNPEMMGRMMKECPMMKEMMKENPDMKEMNKAE